MRSQYSDAVPVKVQKRSGFDRSFNHLLSANVGTLVPVFCKEVIPNTKVNLSQAISVSMPPLASDTYMNVDLKLEAFFCPMRLLYGGFESWFADKPYPVINGSSHQINQKTSYMPVLRLSSLFVEDSEQKQWSDNALAFFGTHSLMDYIGFSVPGDDFYSDYTEIATFESVDVNPLPLICYGLIYDRWYRNTLIQKPLFARYAGGMDFTSDFYGATLPYALYGATDYIKSVNSPSDVKYADGLSIFQPRQRNFGFDYFTNAWPSPQLGNDVKVTIDGNDQFTISQLRSMNSLQQFRERNNLASEKLVDVVKARYNADLSSGVAQMPLFLGSANYNVYSKSIDANASIPSNQSVQSNNVFAKTVGAQFGRAYAVGNDFIIDGFVANEPGYIMVLASLVPKAEYPYGIDRIFTRYTGGAGSLADMANPLLQNVGNQPIYSREVLPFVEQFDYVFGYTDRYADFMSANDKVSGLFKFMPPGIYNWGFNESSSASSLHYMVLQRDMTYTLDGNPGILDSVISSAWLEIPINFFDRISAVGSWLSQYGYWLQCAFDWKISQPLEEYSVPSLQDPAYEHGDTVIVHRGGFKL